MTRLPAYSASVISLVCCNPHVHNMVKWFHNLLKSLIFCPTYQETTMHPANDWWTGSLRAMLPLAPLLAVAIPVHAQISACAGSSCVATDPAGLADTAEPGSVLVFPKFAQGLIALDNGAIEPNTQIEIAAVCPVPAPPRTTRWRYTGCAPGSLSAKTSASARRPISRFLCRPTARSRSIRMDYLRESRQT